MNTQEFLKQMNIEQLEEMARAQTATELLETVRGFGLELTDASAEEVFAALFPVRGKELDDGMLALITGGAAPKPTRYTKKTGTNEYL